MLVNLIQLEQSYAMDMFCRIRMDPDPTNPANFPQELIFHVRIRWIRDG